MLFSQSAEFRAESQVNCGDWFASFGTTHRSGDHHH
jgi:hypothetical protein